MTVDNSIPPNRRILVRSADAADLLSMSYEDFRRRVRSGGIPVAEYASTRCLFSVDVLRSLYATESSRMTDSHLEQEPDVSARLLRHIVANLDEELIATAMDALRHFLTCAPEYAEFVMAPMFDLSEYWPQTMAAQLLGLPLDQEYDPDELLDRLENPK